MGDPFDAIFNQHTQPRETHPAGLSREDLLEQCSWARSRTGGPGGQHRNKVETAVELVHTASGIRASAGERRSVKDNMRVAVRRLRLALATGYRVSVPAGECRSELWRSRTKAGRIVLSEKHEDFPTMLAEALDVIDACGHDVKQAAVRLEVTMSQLVKLVKAHPPALVALNAERAARGEHALK